MRGTNRPGNPPSPRATQSPSERRRIRSAAIAGIFALAVAVYTPTTRYAFTGWDDTAYVVNNPHVTSAGQLLRNWTSPDSDVFYPLTYSSYWLEYRLWGAWPAGYHATNALLHGVNSVLVALLLVAIGTTFRGAALGAALFAVHPLQVMTVAWIAERKNLLALLFTLLALLAWVHAKDGKAGRLLRALALLAFIAALASKTVVLGLPVAFLHYDILVRRRSARTALPWAVPMLLASCALAYVTVAFERPFIGRGDTALIPGFLERLQIAGVAPWFYVAKLVVPVGLSPAYPRWHLGAEHWAWWLPLVATAAVGSAFARLLPRLRSAPARRSAWLVALAAILLAPSLGLIPFANLAMSFVSDHFLYVASPGIFGALGSALDAAMFGIGRLPRAIGAAAIAATAACAAATIAYEPVFRNAESLWTRVLTLDPDSYAGNLGLAEAWTAQGRFSDALPKYERAIALEPRALDGYLFLGEQKKDRGDAAGAAALFARGLALYPSSVPAMVGLASANERLGAIPKARDLYERAVGLAPRDVRARMGLGGMYLGFARPAEALRQFAAVIEIVPAYPRAYLGAATALRSLSRYGDAVDVLKGGVASCPNDVALLNLLALTLATAPDDRVRNGPSAASLAEQARATGPPGSYELRATLAAAYAEAGRFEDALRESRRAAADASAAQDDNSAAENQRRSDLYEHRQALRLGR
jgi:tetratricopeptide (TPR) repeat protein